ncbi:MAG TPA: hydantoinase B/oxoprolinase family protein [Candidatus Binataceae bacterium]|nr:hydantoinase B/oxoprolinase family protein [Candidatus Binataceae bacterium]
MAVTIPGSEIFAYKGNSPEVVRAKAAPYVNFHEVSAREADHLDPLSFEVIRHRLWMATEEMGDAIKRMSGSIVVTDANDFNFALMDEVGDLVQIGPYNAGLAIALDRAVKWTLEYRAENPGIEDGDMFLCNDPWVGGGMHQNDVAVYAPLFWEGKLFGWTSASSHQLDLGGVAPGSWTPRALNVFWESLPTPPVKIVRSNRLQRDVEDVYLRRSRIPRLVALDLRAQIGANNFAHEQIRTLIRKYGPDMVKAVMKRMLDDTEHRVRAKLRAIPDGNWHAVAYQEEAREGDRGLYKIVLNLTKKGERLTFDFRGTDPQVEGLINCTHATLHAGILWSTLPSLCGDVPWAAGGLLRCIDIISEDGTLNNCTFPAGISKASVASGWTTANAVQECLAKMIIAHPEHRKSAMSVCTGTWSLAVLSGIDQYRRPFVTMLMDPMAGGIGARTDCDGIDTGGLPGIVMGRAPDVEMVEFMNPLLYLWRREERDSGGPGQFRGGMSASMCIIPHKTDVPMSMVVSGSGKAVSMNVGLNGGYPGSTQVDITIRDSNAHAMLRRGVIPEQLSEIEGQVEYQPSEKESYLNPADVHFLHWQGAGGMGDPILRDPEMVRRDILELRVAAEPARDIYGVVLDAKFAVDTRKTEERRRHIRNDRKAAARRADKAASQSQPHQHAHHTASDLHWNDNLVEMDGDGRRVLKCNHCGHTICDRSENYLEHLALVEGASKLGGPQIFPEPWRYIDTKVQFRQFCCPGCYTAFLTQVVPENHPTRYDLDSAA